MRNYRDGAGKHRQELLCHLGKHDSLDAAIAAERAAFERCRKEWLLWHRREKDLRTKLEDAYWIDIAEWGYIPGPADFSSRAINNLLNLRYHYELESNFTLTPAIEDIDVRLDFLEACREYHEALNSFKRAEERAARHKKRLERFLRVQREHFGG